MEQLRLSDKLVNDLQAMLMAVDERAKDPFITVQYLAAITGYIVGKQDMPTAQKQEAQEELAAFTKHVMEDIDQTIQRRKQQSTEAFGIWRPGDS